ncbi:MAG: hypothetical protein GTO41_17960, partial [Burkholderiales bacterium]|nr:hypothetical protein [Burkholderiales bacterium]
GECLWYVISGNYKNNPKTNDLLNRDTNGQLEIMAADGTGFIAGATPPQRAVAVIFAPGAILPGQDRTLAATNPPSICGGNYDPANYLDTDVASSIDNAAPAGTPHALTRFIAAEHSDLTPSSSDTFNDQLMAIFPEDIFVRHVEQRTDFEGYLTDPLTGLLRKAADCLVAYGRSNDDGVEDKFLPWSAPLDVVAFGNSSQYIDIFGLHSGRLPRTVYTSAILGSHDNSNYFSTPLLVESRCAGWNAVDEFWESWKDHLFYAVARGHHPYGHDGHDDNPCSDDECIDVEDPDGIKTDVAAVVIFS